MNKNTFINAMTQIDDSYIDEIMEKRARLLKKTDTRKPVLLMRVMPIAAAVAILAAGVIATFSMANRNKPEVPGADDPIVVPPVVDTEPEHTNTIVEGAFELEDNHHKSSSVSYFTPMSSIKALSYYLKSEKVYIKVGCGFPPCLPDNPNEFAEKLSKGEASFPTNLFPEYSLLDPNPAIAVKLDNDGFILHPNLQRGLLYVNGNNSDYLKIFTHEDGMPFFGASYVKYDFFDEKKEAIVSHYKIKFVHYEEIEIDFSKIPAGSQGYFSIGFGWWGDEDFIEANGATLFYYASENGVGISFKNVENAKQNLEKVENARSLDTNIEDMYFRPDRFAEFD